MITEYPSSDKYLDSETGLVASVKGMDNCSGHIDYENLIGRGLIPGHEVFEGYGQRSSCSTAVNGDDVWEGVATTMPIPNQVIGEQMTVVSTSAQDGVAGTGILTLDIHGLDATGAVVSEIVVMQGTTPVSTTRTNWRFIQSIHAETVGTNNLAVGDITIYKTGFAATVYNKIVAGGNMSLNSARMVPVGKTFYLKTISYAAAANKSTSIKLRSTTTFENTLTASNFFLFKDNVFLLNSTITKVFPIPRKYIALSIIKATVYSSVAGGDVSVSYGGWIE